MTHACASSAQKHSVYGHILIYKCHKFYASIKGPSWPALLIYRMARACTSDRRNTESRVKLVLFSIFMTHLAINGYNSKSTCPPKNLNSVTAKRAKLIMFHSLLFQFSLDVISTSPHKPSQCVSSWERSLCAELSVRDCGECARFLSFFAIAHWAVFL